MLSLSNIKTINLKDFKKPLFPLYEFQSKPKSYIWESSQKYRDIEGNLLNGFYGRIFSTKIEVLFISQGVLNLKYSFPKLSHLYQHKWIHWENLLFAYNADDHPSNEIQQVLDNKKAIGFYIFERELLKDIEGIAKKSGLLYAINELPHRDDLLELGICQNGKIGEHFNMDEIAKVYNDLHNADFGFNFFKTDTFLKELSNRSFEEFLTDWDYANPASPYHLVQTGLLLGYPIESTYALITGEIS